MLAHPVVMSVMFVNDASVNTVLATLTIEQKLGQMVMAGFPGPLASPDIARLIRAETPGRGYSLRPQLRVARSGAPLMPAVAVTQYSPALHRR